MQKTVSIILITFNAQEDLKECLESLENQTYVEKEIVIVNDASTDGTLDFLKQYQRQTSLKMAVITNDRNLGVAGARNVGIQHATGEIIAFTDADCVADKNWISELVQCYTHMEVAAVGGSILNTRISNIWELVRKGHDYVAPSEGFVTYIQGCNMSFAGNVLKEYMFNDEIKYGYEETLLCDYLIRDGYSIYYRPQAMVHHKHRSSLSGILKQKYLRGVSSIWYRKKQNKLFMFKRHIIFLVALCLFPLSIISIWFSYLSILLFLTFCLSLLRDEIIFKTKSFKEILITFPLLIFVELSHFWGSCIGILKFRFLLKNPSLS